MQVRIRFDSVALDLNLAHYGAALEHVANTWQHSLYDRITDTACPRSNLRSHPAKQIAESDGAGASAGGAHDVTEATAYPRSKQLHAVMVSALRPESIKRPQSMWGWDIELGGLPERARTRAMLLGLAMRTHFQQQTATAVDLLTDQPLRNLSGSIRKPTVMLHAEVNGRGTLYAYLLPVSKQGDPEYGRRGDFQHPTWDTGLNTPRFSIVRLLAEEWCPGNLAAIPEAHAFLQQTLLDCCDHLMNTVSCCSHLLVLTWPEPEGGDGLAFVTKEQRLSRDLARQLAQAKPRAEKAHATLEAAVAKLGIAQGQYVALRTRAIEAGERVTARMHAETGRRFSTLQTDRIDRLTAESDAAGAALRELTELSGAALRTEWPQEWELYEQSSQAQRGKEPEEPGPPRGDRER